MQASKPVAQRPPQGDTAPTCPSVCSACDHKSIQENNERATWVSQETLQHGLLWMQRGEMVRGSVGKARGLEKNAISKEPGLEEVPLPSLSSSQQFREKLQGRLSASHRCPHCTSSGQARVDLPVQVLITGLDTMLILSRLLTLILR